MQTADNTAWLAAGQPYCFPASSYARTCYEKATAPQLDEEWMRLTEGRPTLPG